MFIVEIFLINIEMFLIQKTKGVTEDPPTDPSGGTELDKGCGNSGAGGRGRI
jgi:hypothetical protein